MLLRGHSALKLTKQRLSVNLFLSRRVSDLFYGGAIGECVNLT